MKRMLAFGVFLLFGLTPGEESKNYSDWLPPVNLGPVVNSLYIDSCVAISKDGLSLYFSSTRDSSNPYDNMQRDLFVSTRSAKSDPWGQPAPLTMLNTSSFDSCPAFSLDEHLFFFSSNRPGGCGLVDLWVSRRHDRRDHFGWGPPVNLGCENDGYVNGPGWDVMPAFFEDETGRVLMYFTRITTAFHLYQSEMRDDDTFGPPSLINELNSAYSEQGVTVRRDGLEVIFGSNRPVEGVQPGFNFWSATRSSTSDPWSEPVFVPSLGSPAIMQGRIALSFDGCELYFTSLRGDGYGKADLWVATRVKQRGNRH